MEQPKSCRKISRELPTSGKVAKKISIQKTAPLTQADASEEAQPWARPSQQKPPVTSEVTAEQASRLVST